MKTKSFLHLILLLSVFLLQVTYPALDKGFSTIEVIDNIEDVKLSGKKDPLAQHDVQTNLINYFVERSYSKRFTATNEHIYMQYITEVGVPPPRA